MAATEWTLEQLTTQVAEALNGSAYAGAPNGRVREVPDARAVRWYTTIGLVDRPAMRGRTALYGPRHLLQLVAVKRRQSQGFKIADIQAELANAPDDVLQRIAELSDPPPPLEIMWHGSGTSRSPRFWIDAPADHRPPPPGPVEPSGAELVAKKQAPVDRAANSEAPKNEAPKNEAPDNQAPKNQAPKRPEREALLSGVPLGGGAVLLLPSTPAPDDLGAIRAAAGELMTLLHERGLLTNDDLGMRGSSA